MRGLKKGALTQEQVDTMLAAWIDAKESKIQARVEMNKADMENFRKAVSGEARKPKAPVADESSKETADAIFHATDEVATEVAETVEAVVEVTEEVATEVVEEAVTATEEVAETVEEVAEAVSEEVADEAPEVEVTEEKDGEAEA
ncbi:MAG: hypothetical protein WAT79_07810 [Saprospiraceae bacterium]